MGWIRKMFVEATATSAISNDADKSHPTIVMGCAIANDNRLVMLRSNAMFATSANISEIELIATSHFGSSTFEPWPSSFPGGMYSLHFSTSAHMEKA
jgi:hypothetical protein